jgi:hypothetical protein
VTITDVTSPIGVEKTAHPDNLMEPGGEVTFTVALEYDGPEALVVDALVDDVHGDLDGRGTCSVPQTLEGGASYACSFSARVAGGGNYVETDIVTASAHDDEGNSVLGSDAASVTIVDDVPSEDDLEIEVRAAPTSIAELGGDVTFEVALRNVGWEPLTLQALVDDLHGDLDGRGDCSVPQSLKGGSTYTCAFSGTVAGNAGERITDIITVTLADDERNIVLGTADAMVVIADRVPTEADIELRKRATPTVIPSPGGPVTFSVTVQNVGPEVLMLDDLVDDVYGDLDGEGDCVVPQTLIGRESYACRFVGQVSGATEEEHRDVVIAALSDDEGHTISVSDTATVTIAPAPAPGMGCIEVVKVDGDDEPLCDWAIHAHPSGGTGGEVELATNAQGCATVTVEAEQYWTIWEEERPGWKPVTAPVVEVWVPEALTACVPVRFKNRRLGRSTLYLPLMVKDGATRRSIGATQGEARIGIAARQAKHWSRSRMPYMPMVVRDFATDLRWSGRVRIRATVPR